MKRLLKAFIIIIVFLIFINVKANTTFTNTPKFVNDYINKFPNYQRYIITENTDYGFISGNIQSGISGFKNGGLLNIEEYNISKSRGNNTYLFNGLEFFTMTFSNGKIQVIDPNSNNGIGQKRENEASGIRVTNYVQNGVKLEGRGTLVDPWKFIDRYSLQFYYDDTKITIKPSIVMVPESGSVTVDIIPTDTYRYASDNCGGVFNNNKLTINNISGDMICTVEADLRAFDVTFYSNEGIVANANGWNLDIDLKSANKKIVYNSKIGTLPIAERNGYNFAGWYTASEGGTPVDSNTIVKGELNAYAHWEGIDYTLTYDNDGGSGCTSKTAKYDSTWGELCTPNKTGYVFDYWYDFSGNRITSNTKVTGDLTVKAHWTAKTPTVTFNANGGSVSPTSKTVTYNQKYGTLPTPTKSGSTFAGWYKESSLTNLIDIETIVQTETNHTLYARWLTNISAVTTSLCLNPTYDGSSQRIVSTAGTGYKWTDGETKIDAGSQNVTATLQSGYIWSDGTTGTKTISCSIQPKRVEVTWGSITSFEYTGSAQAPTASITTGISAETMTTTRTTETNVGSYTSTASCSSISGGRAKCGNYTLTNITQTFTINNVKITFNKGNCNAINGTTTLYTKKGATKFYTGIRNTIVATIPSVTPANGYTFNGWYTNNNSGSKVLNANGSLTGTAVSGYTTSTAFNMIEDKTLYANCSINKLTIIYNGNGGTWDSNHTTLSANTNGDVLKNGVLYTQTANNGDYIDSESGLANYNNKDFISFYKTGYTAVKNKQWCVNPSDQDTCFDHGDKNLTANQLASAGNCDLSKQDCTITLKVNWTPLSYKLVKYAGNYMSHGSLTAQRGATVTRNAYDSYTIKTGTNSYAGASLPTILTVGRTYLIEYTLTRTAGKMETLGGHMSNATLNSFIMNGTDYTKTYKSNDYKITATGNSYTVHMELIYEKSGDLIYIQPNRGKSTDVTVNITNLKVYEVVNAGSNKDYGTKYSASELAAVVSGDYAAVDWYNNESFSTKLSTSTTFISSSATFDNVSTADTKAYIYAKVVKLSNLPTYCTLTADKNGVKWGTKKGTSFIINKSAGTPSKYTNNTSVTLSAGTFYGHTADGNGNTFTCSLTIADHVVTSKYCTATPADIIGEYYLNNSVYECDNSTYTFYASSYETERSCLSQKSGSSCTGEGLYRAGSCTEYFVLSCPTYNGSWEQERTSQTCYAYLSASATSCPSGYSNLRNRYGCSNGSSAISDTNYCMQ